ncbi:hypothetical protein HON71_02010 [Candidatus Woesearchaeota archaeon]|jgi:hypothetical protein|nr:hypothetical protein [Candidatus Woesearchaeota archaeon]MBT5341987.1 hypothetical protein [Candidatus Woesearchaeota archaeon]
MMQLGLGLGLRQTLEQKIYLNVQQKLALKQLLLLELKHPEYPDVVKGLEGMKIADKVLKEKEVAGVLIGGLAEAVWNQRRKVEDLYQHKDVDVMVLSETSFDKFEGGVDWWLPQKGRVKVNTEYRRNESEKQWYENGNGVILSFGARGGNNLEPGLYIPDRQWVVNMREYEARAHVDENVTVGLDDNVYEKFRDHVKKKVKTRLPKFICEEFDRQIMSYQYEPNWRIVETVKLELFDLETLRGINKFKGNYVKPENLAKN